MKLAFEDITIKNFLSFEDEEFNFNSVDGMTIILGKNNDIPGSKNGAGKSNLFSALVYALYGDIPNGLKRNNIPNRVLPNSVPTQIKLNFFAGKQKYLIDRGLTKKQRLAYCNIFKYDDEGKLVDITKSSILLTQKFINTEILKIDMSMFLRAILLSADQTYNFFKLTASQKREFIENLFGLDFYKDLYTKIHTDVLNLSKDINITEHYRISEESNISSYKDEIEKYNNKIHNSKLEYISNKEKFTKEFEENNKEIEKINSKLEELTDKKTELDSKLREVVYAIENHTYNSNKYTTTISKLEYTIKHLATQIKETNTYSNKFCDKCKDIFKSYINYEAKVEEIKAKKTKLDSTKKLYDKEIKEVEELNVGKNKLTEAINKLSITIEKTKELRNEFNIKNVKLKNNIDNINNLVKSVESNKNPYEELLQKATAKLNEHIQTLKEYDDKLSYLEVAESIVHQDTVKRFIIKDMLALLNNRIAYYLNKIGARYTCEFDENMEYSFITDSGEADYNNFSSGERARLAIATSFAFRDFMAIRTGVTSNILIIDEYMDGNLDSLAINGLLSILTEFVLLYKQKVYVISHRHEIDESIFNNTILVEKTNGITKLSLTKSV